MFKKYWGPIIVFLGLLLGMSFFPYIPLEIFNIDINTFTPVMKILYNFACDIGFMIIIFFLYKDIIIRDVKDFFKNFVKNMETSFKYYFIGLLIMMVSNIVISVCFKSAVAGNEDAVRSLLKDYPLYMIFATSIYAPIVEELIFRKSIKDMVLSFGNNKITKFIYIFLSGLIFGSLHVIGVATGITDYLFVIPYMALGCMFAALYIKTDNIVCSMSMHFCHNTLAVILFLVGVIA